MVARMAHNACLLAGLQLEGTIMAKLAALKDALNLQLPLRPVISPLPTLAEASKLVGALAAARLSELPRVAPGGLTSQACLCVPKALAPEARKTARKLHHVGGVLALARRAP